MMQIQSIGLATPGKPIPQSDLLQLAFLYNAETEQERLRLERIYRGSKVSQRHSVLGMSAHDSKEALEGVLDFYKHEHSKGPTTHERMCVYESHATALSSEACLAALRTSAINPDTITQLITVSCTGFTAPGQDAGLIASLELSPTIGRTHIGFMGCHAALNAMRVANALIRADPKERVLLCCTELCTLHFQYGNDPQDAIANALFADGAAAVVAQSYDASVLLPTTRTFHAENLPKTRDMMSWRIGDHGFRMRLDPAVPQMIKTELKPSITAWLKKLRLSLDQIGSWAIHPGGPKIIDAVQQTLELTDEATQDSRDILSDYGNMSSPTILFTLDRLMKANAPKPWVVLGFGPGLAIEAALLT